MNTLVIQKATVKSSPDQEERFQRSLRQMERRRAWVDDPANRGKFYGVPTFFRANCQEAAAGGNRSYAEAGWHLAIHIYKLQPDTIDDDDEWYGMVDDLQDHLRDGDEKAATGWFVHHYPKCMALVPPKRHRKFLGGVRRAYKDGRID